jgi:hypothetical protein
MTTESPASAGGDPRRLLSSTRELTRRVRRAQRATWFPLLVLALVSFAAIPVIRYGGHQLATCVRVPAAPPGARVCKAYSNAQFAYWPIALVLAYVVIAAFYISRSRALGLETRVRPYAVAGIAIAVVLTAASLWQAHALSPSPAGPAGAAVLAVRLTSPGCAIGLALLVLAWAERNRALAVLTLGYLAIVLLKVGAAPTRTVGSATVFLPVLVQGIVLLLGGIGFALAQRPLRRPAS